METVKQGADTLFVLLGASVALATHAGFAFLALGTAHKKTQVNALVKTLVDVAVSTIAWVFFGGFAVYGARRALMGRRLPVEEARQGADLSIHKIGATPEFEVS